MSIYTDLTYEERLEAGLQETLQLIAYGDLEGAGAFETDAEGNLPLEIEEALNFEDAGIMTYNKGIVIRTRDGAEFQLTIVQSRRGENEGDV